jgi:hypothetical protein
MVREYVPDGNASPVSFDVVDGVLDAVVGDDTGGDLL